MNNQWVEAGRKLLESSYSGSLNTIAQIRAAIVRIMEAGRSTLGGIARKLANGATTLAKWATSSMSALMPVYYGATLAKLPDPSDDDVRQIQMLIANQGAYLARFREEIREGKINLTDPETGDIAPGFLNRVGLYPLAAWSIALGVERARYLAAGFRYERRLLGGNHNCKQCLSEAKKGWSPIGSLLSIGKTVCQNMCNCHFIYQK